MIYLDNSATTKPYKEVLDSYQTVAMDFFGNPSSVHGLGGEAELILKKAKSQIKTMLNTEHDIIFTSGGTESNNLAIKGIAHELRDRGNHIITTTVEHPSVLEVCRHLEQNGFSVTYLPVNENGKITVDQVNAAIQKDTILVSVMHVNNEIGAIQPIEEIADLLISHPRIRFHTDHVQGLGKINLPYNHGGIDAITISGHKIHGLKGTGCLLKKKNLVLQTLSHGGSQEFGYRAGTENVAGAVSLAKAIRYAVEEQKNYQHLAKLKDLLIEELLTYGRIHINSDEDCADHIINFSITGVKPEVMIHAFEEKDVILSTKSACSSKNEDASYVLLACGRDDDVASSAIRLSMDVNQDRQDIVEFNKVLKDVMEQYKDVMG
ncbi:cysteine desulfurase family protein [Halalkalibacillus halophilus]|uniref:cysteine desulfurase family protein n=1 Tax=Halalkalibacillus halophilus TaxID=392827 RepID=UPI0004024773|nr:cysteine desulfurase family protein [Halalkalibacillus halophilus]